MAVYKPSRRRMFDAKSVICAFAFHKLLIYSNLYFESFFRGTNWGQKFANQKKKRTNMKVFLTLFDSRLFLVHVYLNH